MAVAAVPAYLGRDFKEASPGLRFGMYLPLWGEDLRSGKLLWTTHDLREEERGPQRDMCEVKDSNKMKALQSALRLNTSDIATMQALALRQAALAAPLVARGCLLELNAMAVAPFTTGLGNEHPLENGFAFMNPYGLPYLPGSGVKGVLRKSASELAKHQWGDDRGWTQAAIDALFGQAGRNDSEDGLQRGALMCWDVIAQVEGDALKVEVMTPHQSHYYQNKENPHESGQPNPINFITVPPRSKFAFYIQCDLPFLERLAPDLALDGRWQQLLGAALEHAFRWLGFGAKTAVGYGAMVEDPAIAASRLRESQQEQARALAAQAEAQREAELAALSPDARSMREFLDARPDKNQPELAALMGGLRKGYWQGESRRAVAEHVKSRMQQERRWKLTSEKKNPLKDHDHQDTLELLKWLQG